VNTKIACLSLAYGWINRITDCLFAQCMGVGLHLWNQANNADIQNNNFYGNSLRSWSSRPRKCLSQGMSSKATRAQGSWLRTSRA
jgi:nitrous oxidase accessory protein NosD